MRCPKCGHEQASGAECARCGVVFSRVGKKPAGAIATATAEPRARTGARPSAIIAQWADTDPAVHHVLTSSNRFTIEGESGGAVEDWGGVEIANEYTIKNHDSRIVGFVVEQGRGFWSAAMRSVLRQFRPLELAFFTDMRNVGLEMHRPFSIYFSRLEVKTPGGVTLGAVERKVSLLARNYSLLDETGRVFATISGPLWRRWTFPVFDRAGQQRAVISKKWGGVVHEWHTDADTFGVDLTDHPWTAAQRAVIFSAALSIDFDYFEDNSGRQRSN